MTVGCQHAKMHDKIPHGCHTVLVLVELSSGVRNVEIMRGRPGLCPDVYHHAAQV